MDHIRFLISCLAAAGASALAIPALISMASRTGLVDRPDERKRHHGNVPLVGGLAAFIGLLVGAVSYGRWQSFSLTLLASAGVLVLVGAWDDRDGVRVRVRLLVQCLACLAMIGVTGVYVRSLGDLFGHHLSLGAWGIPVTVVLVVGLINAFNMMDGIDGLVGCVALVGVLAILGFDGQTGPQHPKVLLLMMACAALPYLAANLGWTRRKIFLGDAGSVMLGYLLAWVLIRLSQAPESRLSASDVPWCVALPVLDIAAVTLRRLVEGKSPFKPDRGHIHHLLMRLGLGPRATLLVLAAAAAGIAALGIGSQALSETTRVMLFAMLLVLYVAGTLALQRKASMNPAIGCVLTQRSARSPLVR